MSSLNNKNNNYLESNNQMRMNFNQDILIKSYNFNKNDKISQLVLYLIKKIKMKQKYKINKSNFNLYNPSLNLKGNNHNHQ